MVVIYDLHSMSSLGRVARVEPVACAHQSVHAGDESDVNSVKRNERVVAGNVVKDEKWQAVT